MFSSTNTGFSPVLLCILGTLLLVTGISAGFLAGNSFDSQEQNSVTLEPGQVVVNQTESLSKKNSLTDAKQGPSGTVHINETDEDTATVAVAVDEFNEYHAFYAVVYSDGETVAEEYLTPRDADAEFEKVPTEATLQISVPVEESVGYAWSESYSLRFQAGKSQPRTFDALVVRTIVNDEYLFGDLPDDGSSEGGD